jgi:hypothetical protein
MKFAWDARKARENLREHGVSFDEATTVFGDSLSATIPDPEHSLGEHRLVTMGVSSSSRLLVVCHTERGNTIRIISARTATRHETNKYENQQAH